MKRLAALVSIAVGVLALAAPVAAGGWAVSTLDEVPAPSAGVRVAVAFTIRQHGVTPVNVTDGVVGIAVTSGAEMRVFPASQVGAVGHYATEVVFPTAGTATWEVRQGWFAPQQLGSIEVAGARSSSSGGSRWPGWGRVALVLAALACAAMAFATRRVRPTNRVPA